MAFVSFTSAVAGQVATASFYNNNNSALASQFNGNVDATNLASLAVTTAKIATGAVTGVKIAMGSDAQGDILFRGASNYQRLAAGTSGYFLKTQGAGANPVWTQVIDSFGAQLLHVREEQTANTGGGTFTSGAWRTRVLNTTKTNEISGASLGSNQITLPAGTYFIHAEAPGCGVNNHKAKLYNITDSADVIIGTSEGNNANVISTSSKVCGRFTIAGAKVFEIQHQNNGTVATVGFGQPSNLSVVEVYTEVTIWKVA